MVKNCFGVDAGGKLYYSKYSKRRCTAYFKLSLILLFMKDII